MKRGVWFIIAEFSAILFGVILGLWLNEQSENRKQAEFSRKAEAAMVAELERNYDALETSRAYHLTMIGPVLDARTAIARNETPPAVRYTGLVKGYRTSAAYDTALAAGVFARMDVDQSQKFIRAYNALESYENLITSYSSNLLGRNLAGEDFFAFLSYAFPDFLSIENDAMEAISELTGQASPKPWAEELDFHPYWRHPTINGPENQTKSTD